MPVGGGDIGANVWVENSDVFLYLQRSGTFDENNEFLKQGRIRLRIDPDPFRPVAPFRQELVLRQGYVEIGGAQGTKLRVWVEVHRPVVHLDVECAVPVKVAAQYESWRTSDRELPDDGSRFGCFGWDAYPGKVMSFRDQVERRGSSILWYHRNRNDRLIFDAEVSQQGLGPVARKLWNPLRDLTFGGMLRGEGFVADGESEGRYLLTDYRAWKLRSTKAAQRHSLEIVLHTQQTDGVDEWKRNLLRVATSSKAGFAEAWRKNVAWWESYWKRSWMFPNRGKDSSNPVWQMGRNYQLFRYMLAANAYGSAPTKFNGGLFTVDPHLAVETRKFNPDWRAWGGGSFTGQNQRLVYWPMLKGGDFEMMRPQFELYRRALANAMLLTRHYWNHGGARFPEHPNHYGLPIAAAYGWPDSKRRHRPADLETGVQVNPSVGWHFESQLEFAYMILEWFAFSGKDISPYLAFIEESVRFYDEHYQFRARQRTGSPLDRQGRLILYPSQALETYANATNPVSVIAGLQAVLDSMLALPDRYASPAKKREWAAMRQRVPPLPIKSVKGVLIMEPAESYTGPQNVELPQFYPLFPFQISGIGRPDLQVYVNTWKTVPWTKGQLLHTSWHQNGIFLAKMGLTQEASEYALRKMTDSGRRFPAFWGPGHDWVPDHNWGGSGMINLQEMLMQTCGREIRLLPAWPPAWDVEFKLHAPMETTVEVVYVRGALKRLAVSPSARRADVVSTIDLPRE